MIRCVSIFGPTASGKSDLALRLAAEENGAVISADSMQIYRTLDVGTAKPTPSQRAVCPHEMIDICAPEDAFSVYDYKARAKEAIRSVFDKGYLPIVVGGTGLYLDALFYDTDFGDFQVDPALREILQKKGADRGYEILLEELRAIDPLCAMRLCPKDQKKIIRGLEVFYTTGRTLSSIQKDSHASDPEFCFLKCNLFFTRRDTLYHRINARVDTMMEDGLLAEAKRVYDTLPAEATARQAIGYKEFFPYFEEKASLDACIEALKTATRHYAKRQMTWFRRYRDAVQIPMDDPVKAYADLCAAVRDFVKEECP